MCLTGSHILVLEDTASVALYLSAALKRNGCKVSLSASVADALAVIDQAANSSNPVALVLADLNLGGLAGTHLIAELSRRDTSVRVIMMSADGDRKTRQLCLDAGAIQFFEKPFDVCDLITELDRIVDMRVERHAAPLQVDYENQEKDLHRRFRTYLRELHAQLNKPINAEKFRSILHQVKGSAALYGYQELAASAVSLSKKCQIKPGPIGSCKKDFQQAISRVLNTGVAS